MTLGVDKCDVVVFNIYMNTNTDLNTATATFTVGETYEARSAGDHNCVWSFTVVKRTAKFITIIEHGGAANGVDDGEPFRVGALADSFGGGEWARPFGEYSMCPVIRAASPKVA